MTASAVMDSGSGVFTIDNPLGSGPREVLDATLQSNAGLANESDENGRIWVYDAPEEAFVDLQSIFIACHTEQFWTFNNSNRTKAYTGKIIVDVDGSTIIEHSTSSHFPDITTEGDGPVSSLPLHSWAVFGDGITFTVGQVITIYMSPDGEDTFSNAGVPPVNVRINVFAVDAVSDEDVSFTATARPVGQTANQSIWAYTVPANGIKLKAIQIHTEIGYIIAMKELELRLNGVIIHRLGDWYLAASNEDLSTFSVPMRGIRLRPGDQLSLHCRAFTDCGQRVSATLFGTQVPIGFTRARSVNR